MNLLIAVIIGSVPGFVWLIFYLHEDLRTHRHRAVTALSFLAGMLSTFAVLWVQTALQNRFAFISQAQYTFPSFLILAGVEELMKFGAFYLLIRPQRSFQRLHEPLDGMIAMITVALGFATIENIASVSRILSEQGLVKSAFENVILRFLGATLLHALSSGLVGYYWAKTVLQTRENFLRFFHSLRSEYLGYFWLRAILKNRKSIGYLVQGLLIATVLHASFNYLIIINGPTGLAIIFLVLFAFFVLKDFERLKHRADPVPAAIH